MSTEQKQRDSSTTEMRISLLEHPVKKVYNLIIGMSALPHV